MSKKVFSVIGMIVSLAMVLCGILAMNGELGGNTSYPGSAPYSYDSGYASFGADFYTYVSNNAAEAASGARTAAGNLQDIAELLQNVCGIFLMGFGMMGFCLFGILGFGGNAQAETVTIVTGAAPQEAAAENLPIPEEAAEI